MTSIIGGIGNRFSKYYMLKMDANYLFIKFNYNMSLQKFIEKFAEAIEMESVEGLKEGTRFRDLDEWNSLAALSVIAMFDEEYDKELKVPDFKQANTIGDLINLLK